MFDCYGCRGEVKVFSESLIGGGEFIKVFLVYWGGDFRVRIRCMWRGFFRIVLERDVVWIFVCLIGVFSVLYGVIFWEGREGICVKRVVIVVVRFVRYWMIWKWGEFFWFIICFYILVFRGWNYGWDWCSMFCKFLWLLFWNLWCLC